MGGSQIVFNPLIHSIYSFLRARSEYIFLLIFILILLLVYRMQSFSFFFMVLYALLGLILYIILKNRYIGNKNESITLPPSHTSSRTLRHIASIVFFVCYALSMLSLLQGFYSKSPWYYVFIAVCTATVASEILLISTERQGRFNLIKSFLIVLNITLSNQIVFPQGIALPDFGLHFNGFVLPILETGFVPTGIYEYFPCHHILSAITILSSGSDPKMTYICVGGFLVCLGILFIYLIGKKFVNLKFGLFAAVLFPCLDYYIMYGSHPEHQAYNYAFSVILLALILYFYTSQDRRFLPLCMLTMTMMVFAHHFSAMIILILVGSLLLVEIFQRYVDPRYRIRLWPVFSIYGLILFAQWIYYSKLFGSFLSIIEGYTNAFQDVSGHIVGQTVYDLIPLSTIFVNTLGSSTLLLLSVIGFVVYFKRHSLFNRFVVMTTVMLTLLLGVGMMLKQVALLPDRLYPYLQVFALVFLAAEGLKFLLASTKPLALKFVGLFTIIMVLSFFSCSSTIAGFETSLFVDEHLSYPKLYTTPQETNFDQWCADHVAESAHGMLEVPLTEEGIITLTDIPAGSILPYNYLDLKTGFVRQYGGHMGQYTFVRMRPGESEKLNSLDSIYHNGVVIAYAT